MTVRLVHPHELTGDARTPVVDQLSALHATSFAPAWSAAEIAALLHHPGAIAFVAEDDAGTCAFAIARVAADEAEVLTIITAAHARRHGHARALLAALESEAAVRGAATMFLEVADNNKPARRLYDAAGYIEAGRRRGYYLGLEGTITDALVLRKALPRV